LDILPMNVTKMILHFVFAFCILSFASAIPQLAYLNPTGDQLFGADQPSAVNLNGVIWVFGGQTGNFSSQTNTARNTLFTYDIAANHVTKLNPHGSLPGPRTFHSSWSDFGNIYVAGGIEYDYFFTSITVYNDFWRYSIAANTWTQFTPTGVTWPALASLVAQKGPDGTIYLFGGVDSSFVAHGDLYRLDVVSNTLTLLHPAGATPEARYHAYHAPTEDGFFVTGGVRTDESYIEDYWFFHFESQTWTQRPIPEGPRPENRTHGVTGRVGDKFVISLGDLFGGVDCPGIIFGQNPTNDTWVYSFATNRFQQLFPSHAPFLKYSGDASNGLDIYAFGGYSFDPATCVQTYNSNILRLRLDIIEAFL